MFELGKVKKEAILRHLTTSKTKQFCETSSIFELKNVKNETILRDFLIFWTWQHPKRSNSARLLHVSNLTTSKTKQFCETSSIFELDNIKNKASLRDFLQIWKVECSADGLVSMRFAIFPLHLSKVQRLPRKIDARSYEVLHLSCKIVLANLQIWCFKMQPISGNQRLDLLTSLMNMSFVLRLPRDVHLCRSSSNVPRLPSFLEMPQNPHVLLTFEKVHNPLRLPRETTSERPKVVRTAGVFPECVARVPVSLWGSGGWGCVRSTLRPRPQPFATVRARTIWPCLWEVLQRWSFLEVSDVSLHRFAWQAWHFVTFRHVLQRVENRFAWQAQYFCVVFRRCVAVFVAGAALWTCPASFFVAGAAL